MATPDSPSTAPRSTTRRVATPPATKATSTKAARATKAAPASRATPSAPSAAQPTLTVRESTVHSQSPVAATTPSGTRRKDPRYHAGRLTKSVGRAWVRTYHRLEVQGTLHRLDQPTLLVANHGYGGVNDVNVFATWVIERELELDRPLVALGHGMAWKIGGGSFMEGLGAVPASATAAQQAFADGCHVIVFPGGDLEAAKAFKDRNKVLFGGRSGFARLAMQAGVPILPIVTAGAGETLFVVSPGDRIAKVSGVERLLRLKTMPVTISAPLGLTVGGGPYLPLPAKLVTRVLSLMSPLAGEGAAAFATRVLTSMQEAMDDMTRDRKFLLG